MSYDCKILDCEGTEVAPRSALGDAPKARLGGCSDLKATMDHQRLPFKKRDGSVTADQQHKLLSGHEDAPKQGWQKEKEGSRALPATPSAAVEGTEGVGEQSREGHKGRWRRGGRGID